jgi:hypothetical protein
MTEGVYVVEYSWEWDKNNTEYATITIEVPDESLESRIKRCTRNNVRQLLYDIYKVAEALDHSIMGKGRLVRLYRVEWEDGHKLPHKAVSVNTGITNLALRLIPVCDFDEQGYPVPCKPHC